MKKFVNQIEKFQFTKLSFSIDNNLFPTHWLTLVNRLNCSSEFCNNESQKQNWKQHETKCGRFLSLDLFGAAQCSVFDWQQHLRNLSSGKGHFYSAEKQLSYEMKCQWIISGVTDGVTLLMFHFMLFKRRIFRCSSIFTCNL